MIKRDGDITSFDGIEEIILALAETKRELDMTEEEKKEIEDFKEKLGVDFSEDDEKWRKYRSKAITNAIVELAKPLPEDSKRELIFCFRLEELKEVMEKLL